MKTNPTKMEGFFFFASSLKLDNLMQPVISQCFNN